MSEKVTFQELIESIAEETDSSKQFTHDFVKDFVDVINDGLKQDGNVNIAGFGKFNLRRVDEREGYNPQSEEKITIPAHNKIKFKPYKDVRELVNAPYKHLEPELIEDEPAEEGSTDPGDGDESDFIPTGPPTSTEETEDKSDSEEEAPFDLEDREDSTSSDIPVEDKEVQSEDDEDIVEFKSDDDASKDENIDDDLEEFLEETEQPEDEKEETSDAEDTHPVDEEDGQTVSEDDQEATPSDEDSVVEETLNQADDLIDESEDLLDSIDKSERKDEEAKKEKASATPSVDKPRRTSKRSSAFPTMIVAAAFIILLAAGGAWYFSLLSDGNGNQQEMASQETTTEVDRTTANDQQTQSGDTQNNQDPQQAAGQNQNQSQSASASAATASSSSASNNEEIEIAKGQTLWSLAEEKYGNPRLWPWIYGKNKKIDNPDLIFAGNSLSVPLPSGPDNSLNSADSVGVAKGFVATYRWYKNNNSPKAKNHILGAKRYHDNIRDLADVKIDEADLSYANRVQ